MNEELIKKAEGMKLKANWIGDNLYVYSDIGYTQEWYMFEENGKLVLKHKNQKGTKKDKRHFHIQKIYKDATENTYIRALQHIKSHDRYRMVKDVKNHKMELFNMIATNNIPRIKFV